MAIRSFYGTYDISIKLKGRQRLPKPKVENKRMDLSVADVKLLVDQARSPRDRALILVGFQGGMDVSTLCSLKYLDVARGLELNDHPLKVDIFRKKRSVDYYTFLGRDAVEALKAYVNDLRSKGIILENGMPMFLKQSIKTKRYEAVKPYLVQNMLRKVAIATGLVDENLNGNRINPAGPHALRESFSSIMLNNGVPNSIVDFLTGHEVGAMSEAYKRGRFKELKQMYAEKEVSISITTPSSDFSKFEERSRNLEGLVTELTLENKRLENKLAKQFGRIMKSVNKILDYFAEKVGGG